MSDYKFIGAGALGVAFLATAALLWPGAGKCIDCEVVVDGEYAVARVCGEAPDAGALDPTVTVTECYQPQSDGGELGVTVLKHPAAPYRCACSSGSFCEWKAVPSDEWSEAPTQTTLVLWRGAGCLPKPCVQVDRDTFPAECLPPPVDGGLPL